jgi:hypothetical protein
MKRKQRRVLMYEPRCQGRRKQYGAWHIKTVGSWRTTECGKELNNYDWLRRTPPFKGLEICRVCLLFQSPIAAAGKEA